MKSKDKLPNLDGADPLRVYLAKDTDDGALYEPENGFPVIVHGFLDGVTGEDLDDPTEFTIMVTRVELVNWGNDGLS